MLLKSCVVVNIYAPSGSDKRQERASFFREDVFQALHMFPESRLVLGGDFNCILSPLDVENRFGYNQKMCMTLKDLVSSHNLLDAFRISSPRVEEFTFFRPGKAPSRLDRFYVSQCFSSSDARHVPSLSDHSAVILKIKVKNNVHKQIKRGRTTYWKLNTAILEDDEFMPSFKQFWHDVSSSKNDFTDIAEWWDLLAEPNIKGFCIEFSKIMRKRRNDTVRFLHSCLKLALEEKNWS